MAVSAHSDKNLAVAAKVGLVDMRGSGHSVAGSFLYEGDRLVTGWHSHELHQLEYALQGVVEVETATARFLLPPQQAAWIPARLEHETTINTSVRSVSVFFDVGLVPEPGDRARILAVPPLIREMMIYAMRWPIGRAGSDAVADTFFETLGHLVSEALEHEAPLSLPVSSDPIVASAMAYTHEHLRSVSVREVSQAAGVSERTLRRLFQAKTGLPWRRYLAHARLLRAMALLAEPGLTVLHVASAVGFDSVSAFTRAFVQCCGESPSAYRRRIIGCTSADSC